MDIVFKLIAFVLLVIAAKLFVSALRDLTRTSLPDRAQQLKEAGRAKALKLPTVALVVGVKIADRYTRALSPVVVEVQEPDGTSTSLNFVPRHKSYCIARHLETGDEIVLLYRHAGVNANLMTDSLPPDEAETYLEIQYVN